MTRISDADAGEVNAIINATNQTRIELSRSLSFRDVPLGAGPESIIPAVVMDSGLAQERAPE
jgi:hypothetical protein